MTIREILSHTSGYQDYWPEDYVMTTMKGPETAQQIIDIWGKKPLDFEPGTQWQYSNTNFVIAGRIVEVVSGENYWDFLSEHIFRPLGMKSVWNSDAIKLTEVDATPYVRNALGPLRVAPKEGIGWMFAAGELAMTPHDLALWDESLLAQSILSSESYKKMFTEVKLKNGEGTKYGLGVDVRQRNGHRSIEHSGEVSGFVSDNEVLIDDGAAVVVLTNQMAVNAASEIAQLTAPLVAGYPLSAPEQQALDIYHGLQQGRIDRSLLAPNLSDYFTPEAVADFQSSLAPLGEPLSLRQTSSELRGGMTFREFEIVYPGRTPRAHHLHLSRRQARAIPHCANAVTREAERRMGAQQIAGSRGTRAGRFTKPCAPRRVFVFDFVHQPVPDSPRPRSGLDEARPRSRGNPRACFAPQLSERGPPSSRRGFCRAGRRSRAGCGAALSWDRRNRGAVVRRAAASRRQRRCLAGFRLLRLWQKHRPAALGAV